MSEHWGMLGGSIIRRCVRACVSEIKRVGHERVTLHHLQLCAVDSSPPGCKRRAKLFLDGVGQAFRVAHRPKENDWRISAASAEGPGLQFRAAMTVTKRAPGH
jgi:hypothetical protein